MTPVLMFLILALLEPTRAQSPTFRGLPSISELTEASGVPSEPILVTTEDGYVLWMYRLGNNTGHPVLIQHGILLGPDSWLTRGKNHDLAYLLLDEGYDVYLGSIRGTAFNRNHIKYKRSDPKFWNFSFHEVGLYDLPAMIDRILKMTGYQKLTFVGHSQGVTTFLVMNSLRPEYNKKVAVGVLLSPVAFAPQITDFSVPVFRVAIRNAKLIKNVLVSSRNYEMFPRTEKTVKFIKRFCGSQPTQDFCLDLFGMAFGENRINIDRDNFGFQSSFSPAGTSMMTLLHYSQVYSTNEFKLLDYGEMTNLQKYKCTKPPNYPLENVTCPIAIFWSINDQLTSEKAVKKLSSMLPNVIMEMLIPDYKYSHLDPIIGKNTKEVLYNDIMRLMKKVN